MARTCSLMSRNMAARAIVGLQAEQDRQVGVELDGTDGRMAQVEGAVEAGGQTVLEEAQQATLAGAGLAGDGADAAGVDQKLSGGEVTFDGGQEVELVDRDLLGEGQSGEVEVAQQFAVVVLSGLLLGAVRRGAHRDA